MASSDGSMAKAFQTTLGLFEMGMALMRQNLRRAAPEAPDHEIDRQLRQWLHERPGAAFGDCGGPRVDPDGQRR